MEASYLSSTEDCLQYFQVTESKGLSDAQVQDATKKYGRNGMESQQFYLSLSFKLRDHCSSPRRPSHSPLAVDT